jgi:peptidoglycan/xylan/chitin deacetylase (PgdA/CDA1 family)
MKKLIAAFLLLTAVAQAQQKMRWPHHKKAVIVLTYDDALASQLDVAVPQLDSAGFKATFFLTGDINSTTIPKWRSLSKRGFELGNHTLYHPCEVADNPVSSDGYTPYQIIREIEVSNNLLFAVDGEKVRTYAYPCAETTVGKKDYVDTLRKYGLVKYARVGGDVDAIITDFKSLDPLKVPSYGLDENTPAEKLIAFVENVQKSGGMGIIMFHGIGGDYITTSASAHRELLAYLKQNKKEIWVTTFKEAMDYAEKMKSTD